MSRPLLICDCDEVLLHMVRHFRDWLAEHRGVDFKIGGRDFFRSVTRGGATLEATEMWSLLGEFFPGEMGRQTLVPHAAEALTGLADSGAAVVILTNLEDHCRTARIEQLAGHGIEYRVETNQGGKGPPVAALVAEHAAPVAVFVDDLAIHHESVAAEAPGVWRLQVISEPEMAAHVPPAPHAHARIDDWREAEAWIAQRFAEGRPADA